MSQPREIFKNTVVLGMSKLVERASAVFLAFFVSRALGPAGLGIYSATMVFYGFILLASEMGSANLIVREISKDRDQTSRYVLHLGVLTGGVSVLTMAASFLIVPHLGYSADLTAGVYIVILAIIPGTARAIQESVFIAFQRAEFITYTSLASSMLNVAACLFLLHRGYGVVSLVASFVVTQYFVVILYAFLTSRNIARIRWEFSLKFAVTLLRDIKTFAGMSILGGLLMRPEIIILSLVSNEAQIGYYSAALKVVDLWQVVPQIFMTNVFPVLTRSYHVQDQKADVIREKSIKYLLAFSLPLTAGIFVTAGPIVRLLFGRDFEASVLPMRLLALNIPIAALFSVLWRVLVARGQQEMVLRMQVITTLVRLGGGYALITGFSSVGAAITTSASMFLHDWLLTVCIRRDGARIDLVRLGWRLALASVGMGVLAWALAGHVPLWVLVPLAAIGYVALFLALKVFTSDDVALLRKACQNGLVSRKGNAELPPVIGPPVS